MVGGVFFLQRCHFSIAIFSLQLTCWCEKASFFFLFFTFSSQVDNVTPPFTFIEIINLLCPRKLTMYILNLRCKSFPMKPWRLIVSKSIIKNVHNEYIFVSSGWGGGKVSISLCGHKLRVVGFKSMFPLTPSAGIQDLFFLFLRLEAGDSFFIQL